MTSTLQQLLHDLYQQLMMPDEANVVPLANRILDAKALLAKQEYIKSEMDRAVAFSSFSNDVKEAYEKRNPLESVTIIQRTPSDLGEVH